MGKMIVKKNSQFDLAQKILSLYADKRKCPKCGCTSFTNRNDGIIFYRSKSQGGAEYIKFKKKRTCVQCGYVDE